MCFDLRSFSKMKDLFYCSFTFSGKEKLRFYLVMVLTVACVIWGHVVSVQIRVTRNKKNKNFHINKSCLSIICI